MMGDMVKQEFKVHELNSMGLEAARDMAVNFSILLEKLEKLCSPNAEFTICKRKLEEACFYAKKSMVQNSDYRKINL